MAKPSQAWRGDQWRPVVWNGILRSLQRHQSKIAARLELQDETEIDAVLDDLAIALRRCWAVTRSANKARSNPQVRKDLAKLLAADPPLSELVWRLDPNARALLESCWPSGPRLLEDVHDREDELREALTKALEHLPLPGRGRPPGMIDHAERKLAEELADTYHRYTGKAPARVLNPYDHKESGAFGKFVTEVMDAVPARLRRYRSAKSGSKPKSVDHLVRLAVEDFHHKRDGG